MPIDPDELNVEMQALAREIAKDWNGRLDVDRLEGAVRMVTNERHWGIRDDMGRWVGRPLFVKLVAVKYAALTPATDGG